MDIKHPRISELFDATVEELVGKGVNPNPRESVWLYALCEDVVMPDRAEVCAWLAPVIHIGPVRLYPVTVQVRLWLDEYCSRWWADDYLMDVLGTAWAMAHAGEAGIFQRMTHKTKARVIITAWAVILPVTFEQLRDGLRRYFGLDDVVKMDSPIEPKPSVDPLQWGELLARACVIAKASPVDVMQWGERQLFDVLAKDKDGFTRKNERDKIKALEALRLAKQKILNDHAAVSA